MMLYISKTLRENVLSFDEVAIPGSVSTLQSDEDVASKFFSDALGFPIGLQTDDEFCRLLEERLDHVGSSLIFRKLIVDTWRKDSDLSILGDTFSRVLTEAWDGKDDADSRSSRIVSEFSNFELLEVQSALADTILRIGVNNGLKFADFDLSAMISLGKIIQNRLFSRE